MTSTDLTPAEQLVARQLRTLADIPVTEQDVQHAHDQFRASLPTVSPGTPSMVARRRRTRLLAATATVVAVAVVAAVWVSSQHRPAPEPAPPVPTGHQGAVLGASITTGVKQVAGRPLPALPSRAPHPDTLAFSPDGTHIYYASEFGGLYSLDLTTGNENRIGDCPRPRGDTCAGMISPDGTRVAYALGHNVFIKDLRTRATHPAFQPDHATIDSYVDALSWAPDGRRLAFVENSWGKPKANWLTVLDTVTGKTTRVTGNLAAEGPPAWSPDGKTLAYVRSTRIPGQRPGVGRLSLTLATVPATGGPPGQVHQLGTCRYWDLPSHKGDDCGLVGLAWAPDGTMLAVTLPRSPEGGPVYAVRTDGSQWHELADGDYYYGLAWQPATSSPK